MLSFHCKLQPNQEERLIPNRSTVDVSIIVPTYNESHNIISLLESIERSVPRPLLSEVVVVDDNSPDKTGEIVETYSEETCKKEITQATKGQQPHRPGMEWNTDNILNSSSCNLRVIHRT
jgi:glycosyltransferase involved in cell wall biosynthesis